MIVKCDHYTTYYGGGAKTALARAIAMRLKKLPPNVPNTIEVIFYIFNIYFLVIKKIKLLKTFTTKNLFTIKKLMGYSKLVQNKEKKG